MDFNFCWEFNRCTKSCVARERQVLFCWRAMLDGVQTPHYCDPCEYRQKWLRGEYTVEAFVEKYNRRSRDRDKKQVLVIDDDPSILFALEEAVRFMGYDCISACDGEDGLILAQGILPDLIITDIIMPKFDGFQLFARLRESPRTAGIPVIVVTARDRKKDSDQGRELGAEAFLIKPFRSNELSAHIDRVLSPSGESPAPMTEPQPVEN